MISGLRKRKERILHNITNLNYSFKLKTFFVNGVFQTMIEENKAMCGVVVECGFPIKSLSNSKKNFSKRKILKFV